jgi:NAD-dependent SIR2 family protein deacetylase
MKKLGKWWRGQHCTCKKCGERFVLEDRDRPQHGGVYYAHVYCPECGAEVNIRVEHGQAVPHD